MISSFSEKVHGKYPKDIAFSFHPNAIMKTQFPSDLTTFWNQRRRWASKTFTMPSKEITAVMMLMFFTQLVIALFLGTIGFFLYNHDLNYVGITCAGFSIKTLMDGDANFYGAKYVQYPLKISDYLFMPLLPVDQCTLQPSIRTSKYSIQWKRLPLERSKSNTNP